MAITYKYMLLSRLQQDCEYFLGWGGRCCKHLWAGNVVAQINKMKEIYNSFKKEDRPEWLSLSQIAEYEKRMLNNS